MKDQEPSDQTTDPTLIINIWQRWVARFFFIPYLQKQPQAFYQHLASFPSLHPSFAKFSNMLSWHQDARSFPHIQSHQQGFLRTSRQFPFPVSHIGKMQQHAFGTGMPGSLPLSLLCKYSSKLWHRDASLSPSLPPILIQ